MPSSRPEPTPSVVAPGNHDGVHLGHRALLSAARQRAQPEGLRTVAMFFDPHPTQLLAPERAPALLTTARRRAELLYRAGADDVVTQPFDERFATQSPEDFAQKVLVEQLGARSIVVGPDFRFGQKRAGDLALLRTLGEKLGFDVCPVEHLWVDGERVSSTRIRSLLAAGQVDSVARLLGRLHDVSGSVVEGDQRGRTLGFPTANLDCEPVVLPADGVYAVVARRIDASDGALLRGVASLGVRPTFGAGRTVEAHLFDFDQDIYGSRLRLGFVKRIRAEMRFDGLPALKAQITTDSSAARRILDGLDQEGTGWL